MAVLGVGLMAPAAADTVLPWPPCVPRQTPIRVGASEVAHSRVDARVEDVTLASKAMAATEHVDIMLPPGYATSDARYNVLYLLHGALGSYKDWVSHGVEGIVGSLPVIVVMPDDGPDGSYSDWYGMELQGALSPPPAWETFHLEELVPWVQAHYRTTSTRYIAGLSSGGGGAMKYAAANPGMFAAAGGFSGADDTDLPGYYNTSDVTWGLTYLPGLGPAGHCTWGNPATEQVIWEDNDPTYLAANLAGTRLYLASGNGQPGPYDSKGGAPDPVESTVWQMNQAFDAALTAAGVAHTTEFYGPGTHSWPYWERDLRHFLAWLQPPLAPPSTFSMRSARPSFTAWGWTFVPRRKVREFTYLSDVSPAGLTARGSGTLLVTTPTGYSGWYTVSSGPPVSSSVAVEAGSDGRLRFTVDLGPSHSVQQTDFGPDAAAAWRQVQVSVTRGR